MKKYKDKTKNFLINTMSYPMQPKGKITFAFVTSKEKGYQHYRKVRNQTIYGQESLSKYGKSLYYSCFKKW